MTDPPRHTCRGRSMVCPGPCNPLRAHQHHHHHHHHRRQKYDVTDVTTSRKDVPFLPDEFTPRMLKSLKPDVTSTISAEDESISISQTSSFTRIALIKVSKTPEEADIPAIMRKVILSPRRLEMLGEPSTSESPFLKKIIPQITTPPTKETLTDHRPVVHRAPRILNDVKRTVTRELNGLIPKGASSLFLFLLIFIIYAGIHVLLAVITWRTTAYQFFLSSQICGILAFLMWRLTGTILI